MTQAKELIAKMLFAFAAAISVAAVLVICIFIFGNGIPAIAEIGFFNFLFGATWQPSSDIYGIGIMVLGSLYVMAGALVIGVPLGILCAVFLTCFGSDRISSIAKNGVQLLRASRRLYTAFSVWSCLFLSSGTISGERVSLSYAPRLCLV